MLFKRTEKINTKNEHEIIQEVLGKRLCELLAENNAFLAGGAITSLFTNSKINDWDIFFQTQEEFNVVRTIFSRLNKINAQEKVGFSKIELITETSNAATFKVPSEMHMRQTHESYGKSYAVDDNFIIQLCQKDFLPIKEALARFDWTCVMGAYEFKSKEFYFHPNFFPDNSRKSLVINENCHSPFSAYFRHNKYKERGYTISFVEEFKMLMMLNDVKFETWEEFLDSVSLLPNYNIIQRIKKHIKTVNSSDKGRNKMKEQFSLKDFVMYIETNPFEESEGKEIEHNFLIQNNFLFDTDI